MKRSLLFFGFALSLALFTVLIPQKALAEWECGSGWKSWDWGVTVGSGWGICASGNIITDAGYCQARLHTYCTDGTFDVTSTVVESGECVRPGSGTIGECVPSGTSSSSFCQSCGSGGGGPTGYYVRGRVFYDKDRDGTRQAGEDWFYYPNKVWPCNASNADQPQTQLNVKVIVNTESPISPRRCANTTFISPVYVSSLRYDEGTFITVRALPPAGWECTTTCIRTKTVPGNTLTMGGIGIAPAYPDYVITQPALVTASPKVGQAVTFSARVNNIGGIAATVNSQTRLCIDDNDADTTCDATLDATTLVLAAKGGSEAETWSWTPAAAGAYQYQICADAPGNGVIDEGPTGEGNNCSPFTPFTVIAPLSCSPGSQSVNVGQNATFNATGGVGPYTWSVVSGTGSPTLVSPSWTGPSVTIKYTGASAPGSKTIRVQDNSSPAQTKDCTLVVNAGGSTISGVVFKDYDNSGSLTPGDDRLANERVYLRSADDTTNLAPSVLTTATGQYSFDLTGIPCASSPPANPQCYRVKYNVPPTMTATTDPSFPFDVPPSLTHDFGIIPVPQAPGPVDVVSTCNDVTITWTDNDPDEAYFQIHRSTSPSFTPGVATLLATVPASPVTGAQVTYQDTTVSTGTYYYKVLSYHDNGNNAASSEVSAVVDPCPGAGQTPLDVSLIANPWVVDLDRNLGYATVTLTTNVNDPDGNNSPYTYTYDCDGVGESGIGIAIGTNPVNDGLTNTIECRFYERGTFVPTVSVTRPGATPDNNDAVLVIVKPPLPIYKESRVPFSFSSLLALSRNFLSYY